MPRIGCAVAHFLNRPDKLNSKRISQWRTPRPVGLELRRVPARLVVGIQPTIVNGIRHLPLCVRAEPYLARVVYLLLPK